MIRLLTFFGLAMIVSAIFAALFLNNSGAKCLPPSALGVTVIPSAKVLGTTRFRGSASDLKILDALLAAAATYSPVPTRIPKIAASDPAQILPCKGNAAFRRDKRDDTYYSSGRLMEHKAWLTHLFGPFDFNVA